MYRLADGQHLQPLLEPPAGVARRQDLPPVYTLNGAVYVARTEWLRRTLSFVTAETVAHVMPPERSIDIDTRDDFDHFARQISRGPDA
jgi:CMP-N,N'-diacetyllegionaminic acid synthase